MNTYKPERKSAKIRWLLTALAFVLFFPLPLWAQATLENPQPDSFQSGIGGISGFVCAATLIEIEFNGTATFEAAYGTSRGDTQSVCGDTNNGFSLLFNWNLLGDGTHTVRALADGVEFANVTVTVTTFGVQFLTGVSGSFPLTDFPQAGTDVVIQWQQALQNFVITQVTTTASNDLVRQGELALATGNFRNANDLFRQAVESNASDPQANLYSAITRVVTTLLDDPVVISGDSTDVCAVDTLLDTPRTGEIIASLRTVLSPEIAAAVESLYSIPSTVEIRFELMNLPECLRPTTASFEVEIDGSDIQTLIASFQLLQATFEIMAAYDFDADVALLTTRTSRDILALEPTFLNLLSTTPLTTAQNFVEQALLNASGAITSVLAETDDQSDDVLVVLPQDASDVQLIKSTLDLVRQSLQTVVTLPTAIGLNAPERLNLSVLFSGSLGTLRPFIPVFDNTGCTTISSSTTVTGTLAFADSEALLRGRGGDNGGAVLPLGQLPDPTFGGTFPDLTQQDVNDQFLTGGTHYADCYTFAGTAGQLLSLQVQSTAFDTVVFLIGPDGLIVDENDDCLGDGTNSCLPSNALQGGRLTLFNSGTYTIEVSSYFPDEVGDYTLSLSEGN